MEIVAMVRYVAKHTAKTEVSASKLTKMVYSITLQFFLMISDTSEMQKQNVFVFMATKAINVKFTNFLTMKMVRKFKSSNCLEIYLIAL